MPIDTQPIIPNAPVHSLHGMLFSIPVTCFAGTLACDIAYWQTANMQWANFSAWLLAIGLVIAAFAVLAAIVDFFIHRRVRPTGLHVFGNALALALAIVNAFVHSRDAYTSVVPEGLILSALTVLILLISALAGPALTYRARPVS